MINCDGYNPVTRVIGGWLNPKWVSGACLDVTGKKISNWGIIQETSFWMIMIGIQLNSKKDITGYLKVNTWENYYVK